jgi:hypothetical protein
LKDQEGNGKLILKWILGKWYLRRSELCPVWGFLIKSVETSNLSEYQKLRKYNEEHQFVKKRCFIFYLFAGALPIGRRTSGGKTVFPASINHSYAKNVALR